MKIYKKVIKYLGEIDEGSDELIDVFIYNKELLSHDSISATSIEDDMSNDITDATNVNLSDNTRKPSSLST